MKQIDGLQVLERQDFERTCPSFYATHPKSDVSDKYAFISTLEIANQLWHEGWYPVSARESRSILPENRGFTRHMIRWAHKDFSVNGERIELVGTNSHNRASLFQFLCGIFRKVCTNGLIAQTADFGSFSVRHIGDIGEQVQQAITGIAKAAHGIASKMDEFKAIEMTPDEQGVFAMTAHNYLYEDPKTAPIRPDQLLIPRRSLDAATDSSRSRYAATLPKPDLWTTYNVIQENITKGGVRGYNRNTHRRVKTRQIKSIEKDVKLNQALWTMTQAMADLKAA